MAERILQLGIALLPVLAFLGSLVLLDSFKLLRVREVLLTIVIGFLVAVVSYFVNTSIVSNFHIEAKTLTRYVGPAIEELLKSSFLIYLIRSHKVGFMVDASVRGFAIGAGFAIVENLYYMQVRQDAHLVVWIIRGFGTALMHGGTTAIVGITAKALIDRAGSWKSHLVLPGLLIAMVIHSLFNHFFLSPLISTLLTMGILPLLLIMVFRQSESVTREWLGSGFDTDRDILEMISAGVLAENRVGRYLHSLQDRFPPGTVADMLCLLRLHSELAVKAKGMLMMRDSGFDVPPDPEAKAQIQELQYLQKSIGRTGLLALHPILNTRSRDLWQLSFLEKD